MHTGNFWDFLYDCSWTDFHILSSGSHAVEGTLFWLEAATLGGYTGETAEPIFEAMGKETLNSSSLFTG